MDASNCKVLFDNQNKIKELLKAKLNFNTPEIKELKKDIEVKIGWCIQLASIFEKRGDLRQAHLMLNESLNSLIDYYFLENKQFIPHFKWKYYYFTKLKKPDNAIKQKILDLFSFKDYSPKELNKRIKRIEESKILPKLEEGSFVYHTQNEKAISGFIKGLDKGIKYKRL